MKDPLVEEIHRYRAAHAKRFNYDIHAIGDDIRRQEAEAGGRFATWDGRKQRMLVVKQPKVARGRALAGHA